jgi:2-polyprenyl-3-methyl-5-hydroxy-6-metoxy-1,4-benzoquinol methylase
MVYGDSGDDPVRQVLRSLRDHLIPPRLPSLEFSQERWDSEYRSGKWRYLASLAEFPRYAVIAGYLRFLGRDKQILEVGCGTGILHSYLKDVGFARYKGIDFSAAAIMEASKAADQSSRFEVAEGSAYSDGQRYDVIIFNEVLYYFEDCLSLLRHYRKSLSGGGRFIISMVLGAHSDRHWALIEQDHNVEEAIQVRNRSGVTWNCKLIRVSSER